MPSRTPQIDQDTLQSLLALDEQLRAGTQSVSQGCFSAAGDQELLQNCAKALQKLEAAIPRRSQSMPSWAPQTIGRFQLLSVLGAGGFAVVYLAHDPQLNRSVALKVPRPHALIQPQLRQRFVTESHAAARLDHPHIVPVFEAGEDGDLPYIACTLCEGPTLADWISSRTTPLNPRITAAVVRQLADALEYSHRRGILHRDIKPGNVLLFPVADATHEEFPFTAKIGDFGLAKLLEAPSMDSVTSQLIGTPRFMAPELLGNGIRETSVVADVYALGAVLYAMLTGQAPFGSASLAETLKSIAIEDPAAPELLNRSVDRDLSLICLKCLEKNASSRYASAAELRDDLDRYMCGQCVRARQTPLPVRFRKWSRRHPVAAVLAAASTVFVMVLGLIAFRYTASLKNLQGQLQISNTQLREHVQELKIAVETARQSQRESSEERTRATELLRIGDINLAGRSWRMGDARGSVNLLKRWAEERLSVQRPVRSAPDIALRYLMNRATGNCRMTASSRQIVWWMHVDEPGERLLLAGSDGRVEFLPMPFSGLQKSSSWQSEPLRISEGLTVSVEELSCVTLSDDRTLAAISGDDGMLRVWKVPSDGESDHDAWTLIHEMSVLDEGNVHGVLFLPGTHQVVTCGRTPILTVWDADSGTRVRDLITAHPSMIESMVLSPDRAQLATAGADGLIEIFRVPDLKTITQLRAGRKPISMAAFSRDGTQLVCGGRDRILRLFSLATQKQVMQYTCLSGIYAVVCNLDNHVLMGDRDGVLTLLEIPKDVVQIDSSDSNSEATVWSPLKRWAGHDAPISAIRWLGQNPRENGPGYWISADRNGLVRFWEVEPSLSSRRALPVVEIDKSMGRVPPVLPVGSHLLQGTSSGIHVLDLAGLSLVRKQTVPSAVRSLAATDDSRHVFVGSTTGNLYVLGDFTSGNSSLREVPVFSNSAVRQISLCQNASRVAAVSIQNEIAVVDWPSGKILFRAEGSTIGSLTPDGEHLIYAASVGDDLLVVRLSDGMEVAKLKGHLTTVSQIAFTRDGTRCITASHDRTICLWDLQTFSRVQQLTGHAHSIDTLAIASYCDMIATGDDGGVIRLWDLETGRELTELDERVPEMVGLQFSREGTGLIAWDAERQLHLLSF